MTQDEIIEMAVQAGIVKEIAEVNIDIMEAFAKLVAAKEREACAEICENFADVDSYPDGIIQDYHAHLIRLRGKA